jgi:hypothetical protein
LTLKTWFLGSVEIVLDTFVKTLLGELIVAGKRGLMREDLKFFEFSAVPSRRAELKNYSQRNSFEPFTSRTLVALRKKSADHFLVLLCHISKIFNRTFSASVPHSKMV